MHQFAGYRVAAILHAGGTSTVYRALRESDGLPVVLKWLSTPSPSLGDLARYRYAWEISRGLDLSGCCHTLDLAEHERRPLLVMRDIGGIALTSAVARGPLPLAEALRIGHDVAAALGHLHHAGVVHRDINPSNIIRSPETGEVEIVDFDLASRLSSERIEAQSAEVLSGTLAYISPEQTGRMNRTIDHRTDLYSLGASLYELLTGVLPFVETDAGAMLHAHLALPPRPPHEVLPGVPPVVSDIVCKLMAKAPEDRYQSAQGLRVDLARCLETLAAGAPLLPFELASRDVSPRLRVSQRLYGREDELQALMAAFERAHGGPAQLLLVDGLSGVGKSALVREVHKPITRGRGRFVSGKHDQLDNVPYAALVEAFRELVRDILVQPDALIAQWRGRLAEALEGAASVLTQVIGELSLILGPQPPAPPMPPAEAQNRFQLMFTRFAQAFAREDHPLALFLDDLQWADPASLDLLQLLLTDPHSTNLLVIGAYRSDEVGPAHPLVGTLAELEAADASVTTLHLEALGRDSTAALVADTLGRTPPEVAPLAEALWGKTHGNPLFLERFLTSLADEGVIEFDPVAGRWGWDLVRIRSRGIAQNVADLMARKIGSLPPATQRALQLAGFVGSHFDLRTLSVVAEQGPQEMAAALWPAVEAELVDPIGDDYRMVAFIGAPEGEALQGGARVVYRFVHDRIQQAAYEQAPEAERGELHLRIGRLLWEELGDDAAGDRVFDVVNQLDRGRELLDAPDERLALARLNLAAGQRAMESAAYPMALRYLDIGSELLPVDAWETERELALSLTREAASAVLMLGEFDAAAQRLEGLLERASTREEQVDARLRRLELQSRQSDSAAAVEEGLCALQLFGFEVPQSPEAWGAAIGGEAQAVARLLEGVDIDTLVDLPQATDDSALLEMSVLSRMGSPAYQLPHVMGYLTTRIVHLTVLHGSAPDSPMAYVLNGFMLCMQGDFERGDAYGRLGLALNERSGGAGTEAPLLHLYATFIHHWRHPMADSLTHMMRARGLALQTGNYQTAGWAAMNVPWLALACGRGLHEALRAADINLDIAQNTVKHTDIANAILWTRHQVLRLMGRQDARQAMDAEGHTEAALMERLVHFVPMLAANRVQRLEVACIQESWEEALEDMGALESLLPAAAGSVWVVEGTFYSAMVLTALHGRRDEATRAADLGRLQQAREQLSGWAEHSPANNLAKLRLLEAELGGLGHPAPGAEAAEASYDAAIEAARAHGLLQVEALACERAAAWHEGQGHTRLARTYHQDAHLAWARWGARARVEELEARRPELRPRQESSSAKGTVTARLADMDLETVLEATRAISGEILLDDLLTRVMRIVLSNAGAGRAALILKHGSELRVAASVEAVAGTPVRLGEAPLNEADLPASVVRYVARAGERVVLADARLSDRFGQDPYVVSEQLQSVVCTPVMEQRRLVGVLYLENRLVSSCFTDARCELLDVIAAQAAVSIANALMYRRQEEMTESLRRFVPRELLDLLGKESILEVGLGDATERPMTVLFSDIRDFTSISARMTPPEVFEFLNAYLAEVGPVIREHSGFIDKYIGDALMALFTSDVEASLRAAIGVQSVVSRFNNRAHSTPWPRLRVGVGIHHGLAMLGTIGESKRLEGTVISDTVNTAARLESLTKVLGADILVSQQTFDLVSVPDRYPHRSLGSLAVRGRDEPVSVLELLNPAAPEEANRRAETREVFEKGVQAWGEKDTWGAGALFQQVLASDPTDGPARYFLDQVKRGLDG